MTNFLLRDASPLTPEQFRQLDGAVTEAARQVLVGRRFIPIFGPLGSGVQVVVDDVFADTGAGRIDLLGTAAVEVVHAQSRRYIPLPMIYKDFTLNWRDLETSDQFRLPLELSPAEAAATVCAHSEDELIFRGHTIGGTPPTVYEGLLNAAGRTTVHMSDWNTPGGAFRDVVAARQALTERGFYGPYALTVSPRLYANMHRVYEDTAVLEIEQVQKLAAAGVYQTSVLPDPAAVLVSIGAANLDLPIGQDLITAFLETSNMSHYFRVFEVLALRIKRPGAICTLEPDTSSARSGD